MLGDALDLVRLAGHSVEASERVQKWQALLSVQRGNERGGVASNSLQVRHRPIGLLTEPLDQSTAVIDDVVGPAVALNAVSIVGCAANIFTLGEEQQLTYIDEDLCLLVRFGARAAAWSWARASPPLGSAVG